MNMNEIKTIGIMRLSALGDIVWTIPMVRCLQKEYPEAKIIYFVDEIFAPIIEMVDGVDVKPVKKPRSLKQFLNLKRELQQFNFDLFLCTQANLRVNLLYPFIHAKRKIGFDKYRGRDGHRFFVKEAIPFKEEHSLEAFLGFFTYLTGKQCKVDFSLHIGEETALPENKFIVIHPVASNMQRTWSAKNYGAIIDFIKGELHLDVVVTGGGRDSTFVDEIKKHTTKYFMNLSGKTSLRQLAYILKEAELIIAPDSGPIHLAQALGTKTLGLYAALPPQYTGPYKQEGQCINAYPLAVKKFLNKNIEQIPWRTRVYSDNLMDTISIEEVCEKLKQLV